MYNTFILNFSSFSADPSPPKVLEYVKSHALTYQYLVPFSGTIIIKSTANLSALIGSYTSFLRPNEFLLTHVDPTYVNGLLQNPYWQWINSASPPALIDQSK